MGRLKKSPCNDHSLCVSRSLEFPPSPPSPMAFSLISFLPPPRKQELEKLISYSGTPTAVWRRTGEICLVGLEFSMLTEWSQQDLQKKFIYEVSPRCRVGWQLSHFRPVQLQVFERQSVVEYWEAFARHSFE